MAPKKQKKLNSGCSDGGVAVIYARFSSHAQKEESIEQQVDQCTAYAQRMNIPVLRVYDDKAISGKTDKRPNFQRMMRDASKGEFQYIIAWKSNRFGRNMREALTNEFMLDSYGVRCLYVEEDFDDTAAGRFALRNMMNVNQFYSENMAEDIRRGMRDNALKCKITNGNLPFGYKKGEDGRYAIDEEKAKIVQEIFTRIAAGEVFMDIVRDLNERGLHTSRNGTWNRSSFGRMIHNERYRGVYIYDDIRVEGGIPRIISDELYFRVQEVLKTKNKPYGKHENTFDYLLTGKLFCGYCQTPMTGYCGTGRNGVVHHYYVCNRRKREGDCKKKNVRQEDIELAVARAIKQNVLRDDVIEWIADCAMEYQKQAEAETDLALLQTELDGVKKSIANIMTAIEQGIITETTKSRMLELEEKQVMLGAKIESIKLTNVQISREDIVAGLKIFKHGNIRDVEYQKQLFDTFLVAVYLYDDKLKLIFNFTKDKNSIECPCDLGEIAEKNISEVFDCRHVLSTTKDLTFVYHDISEVFAIFHA